MRQLGNSDLIISPICLGTMQFGWSADKATSHAIMSEAVALGCNFFDSADIYSSWVEGNVGGESEAIIGRWLANTSTPRDQLILATKVRGDMPYGSGLSRTHIFNSIDASLKRLNTDYIDLYQVHFPDEETELEETLRAFTDLIKLGKVRHIGCSNFPAWLLMKSLWISDKHDLASFISLQPHYNLAHRAEFESGAQAVCVDQQIGVIPYSPLAGGFLTGKYRQDAELPNSMRAGRVRERYMNGKGFGIVDRLEEIGRYHSATIPQTAIAWLLANPVVSSVIVGANTIHQLRDTIKGATVQLTPEQKAQLDVISA